MDVSVKYLADKIRYARMDSYDFADLMEKSTGAAAKKAAEPPAGPAAHTTPPQEPHSAPQKDDTPAEGKSPASPVETPQRAFEGEKAATATTAPSKENTASEPVSSRWLRANSRMNCLSAAM